MEDAVITALRTMLTHLDKGYTHVRMIFMDFISAFNPLSPHKLFQKLSSLGTWILDFLSNRPQKVRMGDLPVAVETSIKVI